MTTSADAPAAEFWELAEPYLARDGVDEGTILSFPCLQVDGHFFATGEHRSGDLIVKLPKERVAELVAAGDGEPFAPAGRTFKEWVRVPRRDPVRWTGLMDEALAFVGGAG